MKDVEISFKGFKLKKIVSLMACASLALTVLVLPVDAALTNYSDGGYTGDATYTGDAVANGVEMPNSLRSLLSEEVALSNGNSLGIFHSLKSYLLQASDERAYEQVMWDKFEIQVKKALDEIKNQDFNFTNFNGQNEADHQAYIDLMNDIATVDNGTVKFESKYRIVTRIGQYYASMVITNAGSAQDSVASGDAKDPSKVIDFIESTDSNYVHVTINEEQQTMPKGVFQAAKEAGKTLTFTNQTKAGASVMFTFEEGFTNDVDMDFGIEVSTDNDLTKNLTEENALVFDFSHKGVLPGPMKVGFYSETYAKQTDKPIILYWLNEDTGKLEKQDVKVTNENGWITFVITHCSSYVTTLSEVPADKLQVAEPKPDEKAPATTDTPKSTGSDGTTKDTAKDDAVKKTSEQAGFKTIALLTIAGAAVFFATRKEEKA